MKRTFLAVASILAITLISGVATSHHAKAFFLNSPSQSTTTICDQPGPQSSTYCDQTRNPQNKITGPNGLISVAANIIALIAGVAAVIIIIIAGIQYATSGGDSQSVNNAKNMIIYASVGLVVVAMARLIVFFVLEIIG